MMLSVVWLSLFLTSSKCYVTNNIKNRETTPKLPVDDEVLRQKLSESSENSERVQSNYIYLEDVLVGLQHQNWTDDELPCLNQTLELILSLQNFTLWAVWEWDAVASQPLGILSGNRHQLGNFDQCMRTPWSATHPEVKTQYCLAEVSLERTDRGINKRLEENKPYENALDFIQHQTPNVRPLSYLTWGACVPTSCAPRSVERLVGAVLARSHLGAAPLRPRISVSESCQRADRPRELDAPLYGFIVLISSLFLICLICTITNARNKDLENHSLKYKLCKAFCLRENLKDLTKVNRDGIEVVYGIRYLTICFIAMCHLAGMMNSGPISNGIKVDNDALSVFGMFVLHDDVFVDTFFVISGFLVARGLTSFDRFPNILIFLIKRYIRLAVALAVVIFYLAAVFPYTGSGPLWNRFVENETDICRRSWWLNLLMISNYVNTDDACLVISWYIPCDFHFFVVAVVTYAVYRYWRVLGTCCVVVLGIASVITPGVINYVNKLQAVQLFTYEFVSDPRKNEQFQMTYIKSHTRAAAYIVGFLAGFFFSKMKNKVVLSKSRATCGACAGLAIMLLVMVSGTSYLWRNYSDIEGAFYAAVNRPVWAVGVSMLILSCAFGEVPLLNSFLSWSPWVPLSRLAYGLYLTHTVIIVRNVGIARNSVYYDSFSVFMSSIGVIFVGTLCALIIWLLAEAPVNNLFLLCIRPKRPSTQKSAMGSVTSVEARGKANVDNGYLHENMPENIHFSSKM